ncbi:MAG: hypothetical protein ACOCQ4_03160, partial [bacterium]
MNHKVLLVTDRKFWLRKNGDLVRVDNLVRYLLKSPVNLTVLYLGNLDNVDAEVIQKRHPKINIFIPPRNLPNDLQLSQEATRSSITVKGFLKKVIPQRIIGLLSPIKKQSLSILKGILKKVIPSSILGILRPRTQDSVKPHRHVEPCLQDFYRKDYQEYFDGVFRNLKPDFIIVEYIRLA